MVSLTFPPTLEQVATLQSQLIEAVKGGASALKTVLPAEVLVSLLRATEAELRDEPSLLELSVEDPQAEVHVFGDTHGHFPDVAHMLNQLGYPSSSRIYVFNGDYVDRGSWGAELLALLCALKCAAPEWVYLLRGNHESSTCTKFYGYSQEVRAKYAKQAKDVYAASKKLFSVLPLAAVIQGNTLVMHGGLFRRPPEVRRGAKRRKPSHLGRAGRAGGSGLEPGSLDDLRRATKGGMDPDGTGMSLLATDVLWSDPVSTPGFHENDARGVGLTFGPDITEAFLTANQLRLVIRSHEGPDARDKRSDMPQVLQGYSIDHNTPAGQLVTVFSAPDYPQFQAVEEGNERYENLAAVAVLRAPDYSTPTWRTFEAAKPRPKADAYYDYATFCDSDMEPEGAEVTSQGQSEAGSAADLEGEEVQGPSAAQSEPQPEAQPGTETGQQPTSGGSSAVESICAEEQAAAVAAAVLPEPPQAGNTAPADLAVVGLSPQAMECETPARGLGEARPPPVGAEGPSGAGSEMNPEQQQHHGRQDQPQGPGDDGGGSATFPDLMCWSQPGQTPEVRGDRTAAAEASGADLSPAPRASCPGDVCSGAGDLSPAGDVSAASAATDVSVEDVTITPTEGAAGEGGSRGGAAGGDMDVERGGAQVLVDA